MRDAHLTGIILRHLLQHLPSSENFKNVARNSFVEAATESKKCEGFLCRGECFKVSDLLAEDVGKDIKILKILKTIHAHSILLQDPVGQSNCQIVLSLTYLLVALGKAVDIKLCLVKNLEEVGLPGWSDCLDKRQVDINNHHYDIK